METREPYQTFADEPSQPLFMVELIDAKGLGQSHGYIGYRFHAAGAQAAADSWNNNRDRGDLVAVIKSDSRHIVSEIAPISLFRNHKQRLVKALQACAEAMDHGKPIRRSYSGVWQEARMLADETLAAVSD
jgi:fructose-specific component phosphotransferase system IIB-like protein